MKQNIYQFMENKLKSVFKAFVYTAGSRRGNREEEKQMFLALFLG